MKRSKPKGPCAADGCEQTRVYRLYCQMHHQRMKKYGGLEVPPPMSVDERFWLKVDKSGADGCWLWTGGVSSTGYGSFNIGGRKYDAAHRYAYRTLIGQYDSARMHLDHLCRVRRCVNPDHLEVVTPATNNKRGAVPGSQGAFLRPQNVCRRGHDMSDAYVSKGSKSKGRRICRTCALDRERIKAHNRTDRQRAPQGLADLIYARNGGHCEFCGERMARVSQHLHHRKLRSQGGTWDPTNVIGVHVLCHTTHPRSIHQNPDAAYQSGHLVHSFDDPALIPVGGHVLLPDGTYRTEAA